MHAFFFGGGGGVFKDGGDSPATNTNGGQPQ